MSTNNMSIATKNKIINTIISLKPSEIGLSSFRIDTSIDSFFFNPTGKNIHFNLNDAGKRKFFFKYSSSNESLSFKEILSDHIIKKYKEELKIQLSVDWHNLMVWVKCRDSFVTNTKFTINGRLFVIKLVVSDIKLKTSAKVFEVCDDSFTHIVSVSDELVRKHINFAWLSAGYDDNLNPLTENVKEIVKLII